MRFVWLSAFVALGSLPVLADAPRLGEASSTRWSIEGGYGMRLWDTENSGSTEQSSYQEKARQGWVLGGDVSVFPLERVEFLAPLAPLGIGISYFRFMKTTSDSDIGFGDGTRGPTTDTYLIEFVGPFVTWRQRLGDFDGVVQAGGGVIYYDNQHQAADFPGVLQSVAPGFFGAVSVDYRLLSWFGVGLTARLLYGSLDNLSYNGIDVDVPPISLTRVDVGGGIRFYP